MSAYSEIQRIVSTVVDAHTDAGPHQITLPWRLIPRIPCCVAIFLSLLAVSTWEDTVRACSPLGFFKNVIFSPML